MGLTNAHIDPVTGYAVPDSQDGAWLDTGGLAAFTHNEVGIRINRNGRIEVTPFKQLLIHHDPDDLSAAGRLLSVMEETLLNEKIWHIEDSEYGEDNALRTGATKRFGDIVLKKIIDTVANDVHRAYRSSLGVVSGDDYIVSSFVASAEWSGISFTVACNGISYGARIDLTDGSITSLETGSVSGDVQVTHMGGGLYWISVFFSATGNGATVYWQFINDSNEISFAGTGYSGLWIGGLSVTAHTQNFPPWEFPDFASRATVGEYFDEDGIPQEAAIDVARLSYDPEDLTAPPMPMDEPYRVNYMINSRGTSSDASVSIGSNLVKLDETTLSADGEARNWYARPAGAEGYGTMQHIADSSLPVSTNIAYSCEIKIDGPWDWIAVQLLTGYGFDSYGLALFNHRSLETVINDRGTIINTEIKRRRAGWIWISVVAATNADVVDRRFIVGLIPKATESGLQYATGLERFAFDRVMIEEGDWSTSHIETSGSTQSRSGDVTSTTAISNSRATNDYEISATPTNQGAILVEDVELWGLAEKPDFSNSGIVNFGKAVGLGAISYNAGASGLKFGFSDSLTNTFSSDYVTGRLDGRRFNVLITFNTDGSGNKRIAWEEVGVSESLNWDTAGHSWSGTHYGTLDGYVHISEVNRHPALIGRVRIWDEDPQIEDADSIDPSAWADPIFDVNPADGPAEQVQAESWSDQDRWVVHPYSPIIYESVAQDAGSISRILPQIEAIGETGTTLTVKEAHSDDDVTYSSFATITDPILSRYFKAQVSAAGDYPIIKSTLIRLFAERFQALVSDLDTSTLTGAYRIGTGDVRLPLSRSFSVLIAISVTLQNVGSGWSWELIDKDTTTGPRIKIYNGSTPADCTIDAIIIGA